MSSYQRYVCRYLCTMISSVFSDQQSQKRVESQEESGDDERRMDGWTSRRGRRQAAEVKDRKEGEENCNFKERPTTISCNPAR